MFPRPAYRIVAAVTLMSAIPIAPPRVRRRASWMCFTTASGRSVAWAQKVSTAVRAAAAASGPCPEPSHIISRSRPGSRCTA
jgi:hypothetical protein